ncbi:MAG: alpha/beta hydrolase [Acidimicrobiia bacterium]|nr:alpha/beta hydrolase [Acidimicrobiia bacterium]
MSDDTTVQLDIAERGAGPSIVFTHGWVDDRSVWAGVVDALASDHHCISWDLRGHGASDAPPPGQYTREHALDDLARVIAHADTPAVLVGHSLGGYLSLAHTLLHPDQVRALVLVASGPGFRKELARDQWNESVDASAAKLDIPPGSEVISKHTDAWVIDDLDQITVPVCVILGERDQRFAAAAGLFAKTLDVRSSVVIPDAGHSVHAKAARPVADAIRQFLHTL